MVWHRKRKLEDSGSERSRPSKSALYKLYEQKIETDDDEECTIPIIVFSTLTDVKDKFALG